MPGEHFVKQFPALCICFLLFEKCGGAPEPWKPEDSLAIWNYFAAIYSPAWQGEVLAEREFEKCPGGDGSTRPIAIKQSSDWSIDRA
jgi:hypothetical protein